MQRHPAGLQHGHVSVTFYWASCSSLTRDACRAGRGRAAVSSGLVGALAASWRRRLRMQRPQARLQLGCTSASFARDELLRPNFARHSAVRSVDADAITGGGSRQHVSVRCSDRVSNATWACS